VLVTSVVALGISVSRGTPTLTAAGPTSVAGTSGTGVFTIGEHTVRQIRYEDAGTLAYTFWLTNDGRLPVTVLGLDPDQDNPRLFSLEQLSRTRIGAGDTEEVTLRLGMGGCETLSSRAGSFVTSVRMRTQQAGLFEDVVEVVLPEELHTGSPREAFCPNSTATSRPPG